MEHLATSITYSLSYMSSVRVNINSMINKTSRFISEISVIKPENGLQVSNVKVKTEEYKESMESELQAVSAEFKLFMEKTSEEIARNRLDERVIFTMPSYVNYFKYYQSLYKKLNKINDIINEKKKDSNFQNDFTKSIAFIKATFYNNQVIVIVKGILDFLSLVTNLKY